MELTIFLNPIEKILWALSKLRYLTAKQINQLYYGNSLSYVQELLKDTCEAGWIDRAIVPSDRGVRQYYYFLTRRGVARLQSLEIASRPSKPAGMASLRHTIVVNNLLILLTCFCRSHPGYVLSEVEHDWDLKANPVVLQDAPRQVIVPDLWVRLAVPRGVMAFWFEIDLGSEERVAWQEKVRRMNRAYGPIYQERFETDSLTFAIVTPHAKRQADLLRWTQAAHVSNPEIFWFSQLQDELFTASVWTSLEDARQRSFWEGAEDG